VGGGGGGGGGVPSTKAKKAARLQQVWTWIRSGDIEHSFSELHAVQIRSGNQGVKEKTRKSHKGHEVCQILKKTEGSREGIRRHRKSELAKKKE